MQREKSFEYDISTFIKMLETRKNRFLSEKIQKNTTYDLKDILKKAIETSMPKCNAEMVLDIFRKIVNQGGYSKNNSSVGKGEIALAMFFGDCSLPKTKGDIEMTSYGKPNNKIEVKGADAGITDRGELQYDVRGMTYEKAKSLVKNHENDIKILLNDLKTKGSDAWEKIDANTAAKSIVNGVYSKFK